MPLYKQPFQQAKRYELQSTRRKSTWTNKMGRTKFLSSLHVFFSVSLRRKHRMWTGRDWNTSFIKNPGQIVTKLVCKAGRYLILIPDVICLWLCVLLGFGMTWQSQLRANRHVAHSNPRTSARWTSFGMWHKRSSFRLGTDIAVAANEIQEVQFSPIVPHTFPWVLWPSTCRELRGVDAPDSSQETPLLFRVWEQS